MKRLVIILSIIAVLGIISPGLPSFAKPTRDPHENPATATGLTDEVALMFYYSQIINLVNSRQYQDAQEALKEIREVDVPDELQYIINRYNDLYQQLFTTLDNIETALDEASDLIARNQAHEAKRSLDTAESYIQDAFLQLEDIETATDTLDNRLGVSASPTASKIKEAYARLKESLEQLGQLIDRLNSLRQSLNERYIEIMGLVPTELSLSITPASVFVGDSVTASGILSGNDKPLPNKNLALILDNKLIATATTTINGSYATNITIPYNYTDTMALISAYEPSGDDVEIYQASQSRPVIIHTLFYPTLLEVSAPQTAHPGLPFTINGQVISNYANADRTIKVLLDDARLTKEIVSGQFSLKVTPPEQASSGKHNLTIVVTPQGRYSGASETRSIYISTLPIHIETQTPRLAILLGTIQISGRAYHELGPLPDAKVSINFKGSSDTARTAADGSFTTSVRTTLDLSPIEQQAVTVTITPAEPWHAPTKVKSQLFIVNPLCMELIIFALLAVWIFVDIGIRTRRREEPGIPRAEVIELPTITPMPKFKPRLIGIKGRILAAYWGGLEAVEKICGIHMAPHITLREFLKTVSTLLPRITGQFTELTTIAENTLYSNSSLHKDTATTAEQLAATIKEELRRGTS